MTHKRHTVVTTPKYPYYSIKPTETGRGGPVRFKTSVIRL